MGFKKTYFIIFAYINKAEFIEYFNKRCDKSNYETQNREVLGKIYDHSPLGIDVHCFYFQKQSSC
jgi:hypothetical protein